MKYRFLSPLTAFAGVAAVVVALSACSNKTVQEQPSGPAPCDPTLCAKGNECLADATGVTACRLPCAAHTDCPFNTQCTVNEASKNFCVKMTTTFAQKPTGQWGTHCLPPDGESGNKACDGDNSFACYAAGGTTDATAYCTLFDCTTDLDCAGGFYCATVNVAPNAKTDKRTFGKTRTVCKKRDYCAPCNGDLDCPIIDGAQSRCSVDGTGEAKYCATPCKETANCRLDASCTGVAEDGTKLCRPRAKSCTGDGSMCAPCRSDADCPSGFCLKGSYTPETFCSVKATATCESGVSNKTKCPTFTGFAGTQIGCQSSTSDPAIPKDQCIGIVEFGDTGDIGCYTKH